MSLTDTMSRNKDSRKSYCIWKMVTMRLFLNATNGSFPFGCVGGIFSPWDKNHIPPYVHLDALCSTLLLVFIATLRYQLLTLGGNNQLCLHLAHRECHHLKVRAFKVQLGDHGHRYKVPLIQHPRLLWYLLQLSLQAPSQASHLLIFTLVQRQAM